MLDNSLVFCVSELQHPPDHTQNNMPFMIAGKAGGKLKTGQWLKVSKQPHNGILVAIQNIFGIPGTSFGHPMFASTGALAGLTA